MASIENSKLTTVSNVNQNQPTTATSATTPTMSDGKSISLFNDWTNNELPNSLAPGSVSVFLYEPKPYEITGEKGQKTLARVNEIMTGSPTDAAEMQELDKTSKETYIKDLKTVAGADIEKYYDTDKDGVMSEDEYINGELTPEVIASIPDDELKNDNLRLAKSKASDKFSFLNMDNRDGKNIVTKDEYAAHLLAMDSNNQKGQFDGKITGEEYLASDYSLGCDGKVNDSQMAFMKRAALYYHTIQSN